MSSQLSTRRTSVIENRLADYEAIISLAVLLISTVIAFYGVYLLLQFFSQAVASSFRYVGPF